MSTYGRDLNEPMATCRECDGAGGVQFAVDDFTHCEACGGFGKVPSIDLNVPGEGPDKRYVVRYAINDHGFEEWGVWDRATRSQLHAYGSRVGANHLASGLNLGWSVKETMRSAENADCWAHAS